MPLLTPGKCYSVNVIYNHVRSRSSVTDDSDLSLEVTEHIAYLLTTWGYDNDKIYYHEKDALPGRNIFDELFRVIGGSEWTIVVLTKGFLQNCWSTYCHQSAFKKLLDKREDRKLVPIAIGIDESNIPNILNEVLFFDKREWKTSRLWVKLKRVLDGEPVMESENPAPSDAPFNLFTLQQATNEVQNESIRGELNGEELLYQRTDYHANHLPRAIMPESTMGTRRHGRNQTVSTRGTMPESAVGTRVLGRDQAVSTSGTMPESAVGTRVLGRDQAVSTSGTMPESAVGTRVLGRDQAVYTSGTMPESAVGTRVLGRDQTVSTRGTMPESAVGTRVLGRHQTVSTRGTMPESAVGTRLVGNHEPSHTSTQLNHLVHYPPDNSPFLRSDNDVTRNPAGAFSESDIEEDFQSIRPGTGLVASEETNLKSLISSGIGTLNDSSVNHVPSYTQSDGSASDVSQTVSEMCEKKQPEKSFDGPESGVEVSVSQTDLDEDKTSELQQQQGNSSDQNPRETAPVLVEEEKVKTERSFNDQRQLDKTVDEAQHGAGDRMHEKKEKSSSWKKSAFDAFVRIVSQPEMPYM